MSGPAVRAKPGLRGWWPDGSGRLREARQLPSPNHDERPPGAVADLLVVHYISLPPGRFRGDAVERLFTNRLERDRHPAFAPLEGLRVSAHFLIRRDGGLLQFVDTDRRAWHAGASSFAGRERCNDFSIGVELEGDAAHRFTAAQYRCLRRLVARLRARHPLRHVAGHCDIAPGRKDDPGPYFDWARLLRSRQSRGLVRPFGPR
jgi:AmpD protein